MPYITQPQYIAPDLFLEHNEVSIYRCYEDDDYELEMEYYWMIFQAAIKANATAIILAHNHPSGNLTVSECG